MQATITSDERTADVALVRQLGKPVVVIASRQNDQWLAEVAALGVLCRAHTLVVLDQQVRELLATDAVDYQFHTGDVELDRLVLQARTARTLAQCSELRAQRLTNRILRLPTGGTVRDLGLMLGLSHQRVHQLMRRQPSTVDSGDAA